THFVRHRRATLCADDRVLIGHSGAAAKISLRLHDEHSLEIVRRKNDSSNDYTPVECEWLRLIAEMSLSSKSRRDVISIESVTHRSRRAHLWAKEKSR